ncbi:hypothetical protein BYT27DRAFT_7173913 [Phlegmacium glaucopus]|nr:hypothetical protein BYT27DRAFT_7173913 [Phlegmacium glaucopus]
MATSFAAYASQYLNRQNNGESTMSSSSQPMFFSFTTDEGSHTGHDRDLVDDMDDPHLRGSESELRTPRVQEEDEDPYLRLDEDENVGRTGFVRGQQAIPLITRSPSPNSPPGWLAHLAGSPRRSLSPVPSASSSSSDSSPPAHVFQQQKRAPPPPPIPKTVHSLSLTDSLLPRDGRTRPLDVFSLPDPRHTPRRRRKYHDSIWTSLWLGSVTLCVFFCILLLFLRGQPNNVPRKALPYTVFLHAVPLLTILTFMSAGVAYLHVYLLRIFVKPVMVATEVFVPATLLISAVCAFVGSFMWDGDQEPTWGETVGLRLFALIPLALSLITARRLLHLPRQIHTASSTLTLTTHILIINPFLLALSPTILLLMLISSLPFVTLIFRLLLHGYATKLEGTSGLEWHLYAWANWAIVGTLGIWLWSWAIARGMMRTTCASVVGAWYFADPTAPIPPPTSTHTIHAALVRSSGPSLGSIALASLIHSLFQLLTILTICLQHLPFYLRRIPWVPIAAPVALYVIPGVSWVVGFLEGWTSKLNKYGLIYAGLTGEPFWASATRAGVLVDKSKGGIISGGADGSPGRGRSRALKRKKGFISEPPLTLLTISPLTLSFPFALTTYLFVAHALHAPNMALGTAVLAGTVTALVGLFCVGLVKDTADTLYLCYCIDKEAGERRREEVFIAFEYDGSNTTPSTNATATTSTSAPQQQQGPTRYASRNPEHIVPRSPLLSHNTYLPQQGQRTVPLSPSYLEESASAAASGSSTQQKLLQNHQVNVPMPVQETDELDPFRGSVMSDEEAALESSGRIQTHVRGGSGEGSKKMKKEVYIYPSTGGGAGQVGHRRLGSAGTGTRVGEDRMMTSAEMNMKSQFLMNLRPFGEESARSEGSGTAGLDASSRSRLGEDMEGMLSEEEEGQLGPGSDFFR